MLASLLACDGIGETPVHVFCEAPRRAQERPHVEEVRRLVGECLGTRARYVFRETHRGLAESINDGDSGVVRQYGQEIVVEDDLVVKPRFLAFMNDALAAYADEPRVMQVSGFAFEVAGAKPEGPSFLPYATSWGWATWRRAWEKFDPAAKGWERLRSDPDLRKRFNLEGALDNSEMLEAQMEGRSDSWAIRWEWAVFASGGLVLYPPRTLVENIGFDGSGTHGSWLAKRLSMGVPRDHPYGFDLPSTVELDRVRHQATVRHIRQRNLVQRHPWLRGLRHIARRMHRS
jgi:hypothetical protein